MKDLVRETDFTTLKNNFDELCDEINSGSEAVALSLSSGRKVFIVPEKNYVYINRYKSYREMLLLTVSTVFSKNIISISINMYYFNTILPVRFKLSKFSVSKEQIPRR